MHNSHEAMSRGPALVRYSTEPDELVGHVLDGRYRVERVLGRGAMGLVLGARHVFLDRPVAIKVLHPTLLLLDESRERFLREARAASQVEDDAVISVSDFGVTAEGIHYLVMEYLEGADLYAFSESHGALSARTAAHIGVQICDALVAIHDAGWVHRDLKPENIWVVAGSPPEAPHVKVIDLGIAAVMDAARTGVDGGRLTRTGHTVGTVHYMSPEQALGEQVDGRSDLYALGCILWELVTGECTFDGTSMMAVMMKHMSEDAEPPSARSPQVPKWFDTVTLRCLAKRREHRFQSARELRDALVAGLAAAPAERMPETRESGLAHHPRATPDLAET
ncbi:MAG: serine/threonine protein kinase, partial [Deltaproteobacteria bacterium]